MINQLKDFKGNALALEIVDEFTEADELFCQQLFNEKLNQGFEQVHVLIKLDELKLSGISAKAFMEDAIWALRNYKKMGHLAVVAHSKIMKALVPIDNLFFKRASENRLEKYFDISQIEEAMAFIQPNE